MVCESLMMKKVEVWEEEGCGDALREARSCLPFSYSTWGLRFTCGLKQGFMKCHANIAAPGCHRSTILDEYVLHFKNRHGLLWVKFL